jgi:chaperone required for assembly of F1-ATPase
MKKFYTVASAAPADGQFTVVLDGRPIKTPAKTPFLVPTRALAEAIAAEWQGQEEDINQHSMMLTGLAYAAIDRTPMHRLEIIDEVSGYAATDLLCYPAENPKELVAKQMDAWQPLLDWAAAELGIALVVAKGLAPVSHPAASLAAARGQVKACDNFVLAALDRLTHISGSLVIALAVRQGYADAADAYDLAHLEEYWQAEKWGADADAEDRHADRKKQMQAAQQFIRLLGDVGTE